MKRTIFVINDEEDNKNVSSKEYNLWTDTSFLDYVNKHGYHFTDKLAEYASDKMINDVGSSHSWNCSSVYTSIKNMGLTYPNNVTIGDLTYAANMAYADFYPRVLSDETDCIRMAYYMAKDVDGYEGMIFSRWATDIFRKDLMIDWENFI